MPPWQRRVLTRLRALAVVGRVDFTAKARDELAASGLHRDDVGGDPFYLKVVLRSGCTLISCHDDAHEEGGEATDGE